VAIAQFYQRVVEIYPAAPRGAALARCEVPGDYAMIAELFGLPDGTIAVDVRRRDLGHAIVVLGRDCGVRATFFARPLASVALSDRSTLVALVSGSNHILEISLDGKELSQRAAPGELGQLYGRRSGIDYASTRATHTHLVRVHGSEPPRRLQSITGTASFSFSADGQRV